MDKIFMVDKDMFVDLSQVESIHRSSKFNHIILRMRSGSCYSLRGTNDFSNIVNRWAKLIEGEGIK